MWTDACSFLIQSGNGGAGCVSFLREKSAPHGGPNGGAGGKGGDVWIVAKPNLSDLSAFKGRAIFKASSGQPGEGKDCYGKRGQDLYLEVPPGTSVKISDEISFEIEEEEKPHLLLRGGRGGKGNASFKTSYSQAPRYAQPGEKGQECPIHLELRLIADVGLIGMPNAGKSSFLALSTRASPEIEDYPFTTLRPNLGLCFWRGKRHIIADIPGLIIGASAGHGLGFSFLRHIQKTKVLVHMLDGGQENLCENYLTIRTELEKFDFYLTQKPELILLNKIDLLSAPEVQERIHQLESVAHGSHVCGISAMTGEGLADVLDLVVTDLIPHAPVHQPKDKAFL